MNVSPATARRTALVISLLAIAVQAAPARPVEGPAFTPAEVPQMPELPTVPPAGSCVANDQGRTFDAAMEGYERSLVDAAAATHGWRRLGPTEGVRVSTARDFEAGVPTKVDPKVRRAAPARLDRAGESWLRVAVADPCNGPVPDRYFIDAKNNVFSVKLQRRCKAHASVTVCGWLDAGFGCGWQGARGHTNAYYVAAPRTARFLGDDVPLRYTVATCVELATTESPPHPP